jgi:hypothetical protein
LTQSGRSTNEELTILSRQILRALSIGGFLLLTAGCAAEGGIMVSESDETYIKTLLSRGENPTNVIAVGRVTVFRPFSRDEADAYYSEYVGFSEKLSPKLAPTYSKEEFRSTFAGWTRLKVYESALGMVIKYRRVLVPKELQEGIQYVPVLGGQFGVDGDLLAARMNTDGFFVVSRSLCRKDHDYQSCADSYAWGLFDAHSGEQLDLDTLQPDETQRHIDPVTYQVIQTD